MIGKVGSAGYSHNCSPAFCNKTDKIVERIMHSSKTCKEADARAALSMIATAIRTKGPHETYTMPDGKIINLPHSKNKSFAPGLTKKIQDEVRKWWPNVS